MENRFESKFSLSPQFQRAIFLTHCRQPRCLCLWNWKICTNYILNLLTPNDPYMGRTSPLTSKRCILYIYSTNIGTEHFKHALYSPFFFSSKCSFFHNANLFGSCIIHILYTGCAKVKKNNSGAKGLISKHKERNITAGDKIVLPFYREDYTGS